MKSNKIVAYLVRSELGFCPRFEHICAECFKTKDWVKGREVLKKYSYNELSCGLYRTACDGCAKSMAEKIEGWNMNEEKIRKFLGELEIISNKHGLVITTFKSSDEANLPALGVMEEGLKVVYFYGKPGLKTLFVKD